MFFKNLLNLLLVNNFQEIVALYFFNGAVNESTFVSSYFVLQRLLIMSGAQ